MTPAPLSPEVEDNLRRYIGSMTLDTMGTYTEELLAALDAERSGAGRLRERIEAIEHPCHEACVGDLHADCQCAAWVRQEALAALAGPGRPT